MLLVLVFSLTHEEGFDKEKKVDKQAPVVWHTRTRYAQLKQNVMAELIFDQEYLRDKDKAYAANKKNWYMFRLHCWIRQKL